MYYKVIYDGSVIDVLDKLVYLRHQPKHNRMVLCKEDKAQAIFSSDRGHIWHVEGLYDLPVDGYDTVELVGINEYEYRQLKVFNGKTSQEVIDDFVAMLLNNETLILIDSLKRLYENKRIDKSKVVALCNEGKITNDQMERVLGN